MSLIPPGDLTLEEIRAVHLDVSEPTLLLANFEFRTSLEYKDVKIDTKIWIDGWMNGSSEDVSHLMLVTLKNGVIVGKWNYLPSRYLGALTTRRNRQEE